MTDRSAPTVDEDLIPVATAATPETSPRRPARSPDPPASRHVSVRPIGTRLIKDLVDEPQSFYSGVLLERLKASNLPGLEKRHQRTVGIAVGQRANRGTFVVQWDGVDRCLESDASEPWTDDYRMGLAQGLWFETDEMPTITPRTIREGLTALDPVADCAGTLTELVDRVISSTSPGLPEIPDRQAVVDVAKFVCHRTPARS